MGKFTCGSSITLAALLWSCVIGQVQRLQRAYLDLNHWQLQLSSVCFCAHPEIHTLRPIRSPRKLVHPRTAAACAHLPHTCMQLSRLATSRSCLSSDSCCAHICTFRLLDFRLNLSSMDLQPVGRWVCALACNPVVCARVQIHNLSWAFISLLNSAFCVHASTCPRSLAGGG